MCERERKGGCVREGGWEIGVEDGEWVGAREDYHTLTR